MQLRIVTNAYHAIEILVPTVLRPIIFPRFVFEDMGVHMLVLQLITEEARLCLVALIQASTANVPTRHRLHIMHPLNAVSLR